MNQQECHSLFRHAVFAGITFYVSGRKWPRNRSYWVSTDRTNLYHKLCDCSVLNNIVVLYVDWSLCYKKKKKKKKKKSANGFTTAVLLLLFCFLMFFYKLATWLTHHTISQTGHSYIFKVTSCIDVYKHFHCVQNEISHCRLTLASLSWFLFINLIHH